FGGQTSILPRCPCGRSLYAGLIPWFARGRRSNAQAAAISKKRSTPGPANIARNGTTRASRPAIKAKDSPPDLFRPPWPLADHLHIRSAEDARRGPVVLPATGPHFPECRKRCGPADQLLGIKITSGAGMRLGKQSRSSRNRAAHHLPPKAVLTILWAP